VKFIEALLLGDEHGTNPDRGHEDRLGLVPALRVEELVVEGLQQGLRLPKLLDLPHEPDEVRVVHGLAPFSAIITADWKGARNRGSALSEGVWLRGWVHVSAQGLLWSPPLTEVAGVPEPRALGYRRAISLRCARQSFAWTTILGCSCPGSSQRMARKVGSLWAPLMGARYSMIPQGGSATTTQLRLCNRLRLSNWFPGIAGFGAQIPP